MDVEEKRQRVPLKEVNSNTMATDSIKVMEAPKKKKVRLGSKLAARLQRSRLNKSKGSMNVSFNTSRIRQTLKVNNKQLARALAESRAMINTLQKQNLELQSNNQKLVTEFNNLKHVSGLSEKEIEQEVEARFQVRMNWLSNILNKMSTQFVSLVETFTELNYTSKFKTRPSSSCPEEQQPQSKPAPPIRSSNILEKVLKASSHSTQEQDEDSKQCMEDEPVVAGIELSPEELLRQPCSSDPDLSVIMEQTNLFENSILATDVEDRGEKYSRGSRRTAMTDFSTLKEFQEVEEGSEGENMEVAPENEFAIAQTHDNPLETAENIEEGCPAGQHDDLVDNIGLQSSAAGSESTVPPDSTVKQLDTNAKSSRRSVRKSRRVRDTGQGSPEKMSLSAEAEDTWTKVVESDGDAVFIESKSKESVSKTDSNTNEKKMPVSKESTAANTENDKQAQKSVKNKRGTFEIKDSAQEEPPQNGRVLRRETFALPKDPSEKTSSPEKVQAPEKLSQKKEDRRDTFVVPPKKKDQPEAPKLGGRKRRGTFTVDESAEDGGILQQTSDVLITDDVLDHIESLNCEVQPRSKSPPRSSIATSDGDVTVNEVLDMELTTAINATIITNGEMNLSDPKKNVKKKAVAETTTKPVAVKSKTSTKSMERGKTEKYRAKETETSTSNTENDKGKNVFKAWWSKPGNITFTSGRKDLTSLAKEGSQKSRSKQKSMLPKKPRSKSARSKPRLMPDISPKTVFDFSGTPRNAVATSSKSVYDMSLNESVTATKQTYQDFKEKPEESKSRPTLKMVKERFAKEHTEEATISPHGIMLVLGDGKRTKPRSKKQVSYSGKLAETHLTTPQVSTSPFCIDDASRTPPGRSSRRASEPSSSDDTISSDETNEVTDVPDEVTDVPDEVTNLPDEVTDVLDEVTDVPDEVTYNEKTIQSEDTNYAQPSEIEMMDPEAPPQEPSVIYEENVKIMPDAAATPTPLKRLKGRKFTSTEEEMKALFESSLMKTPVQEKAAPRRPVQQPEKNDKLTVSERISAAVADDMEKPKKTRQSDNSQKEKGRDDAGKRKKSQQNDFSREASMEKSQPAKQREPSKSPARGKRSPIDVSQAVEEQIQDVPLVIDENNISEENLSPIPNKPSKKRQGKSTKKRPSRVTGERMSPQKSNQPEVQTPTNNVPEDTTTQSAKSRKRGSRQVTDEAKEKLVSPKAKRSQKFDDQGFAVPVGSPPKRPRRGAVVSYKEPSLNCKMRKGDKEGTIFLNNVEVKKLVGSEDKDENKRKKSTDKRTVLKEIASD